MAAALLLTSSISNAQYINNQTTVQSPGNFNISGLGKANAFVTIQATGSGGNAHYLMNQSEGSARWGLA